MLLMAHNRVYAYQRICNWCNNCLSSNKWNEMNWLDGQFKRRWYKMIYTTSDGACMATNLPDIDILLISYDHNKYLNYDAIEY